MKRLLQAFSVFSILVVAIVPARSQMAPQFGAMAVSADELPSPHAKGMVTMRVEDMDVEPAKGAPFCATITTEHTQAFADGNRIHTSENSSVCRDAEGRVRREAALNLLGAGPTTSAPKLITIIDPVAGYRYMLDNENKVAHRFAIRRSPEPETAAAGALQSKDRVFIYQKVGTAGPEMSVGGDVAFRTRGDSSDQPPPSTESLGDQEINGIHATGTRITTTIPAGKMGNEQPMTVSSERWYSPELKATVMSKHTDPWAGELKTQLEDVNTSAPDAALFTVPSDYKIVEEKNGPFVLQKQILAPPLPPQ